MNDILKVLEFTADKAQSIAAAQGSDLICKRVAR